jgi:hypothetical protein
VVFGGQTAQHGEDLDRLLRREHGGRLVEDKDARFPIEGLEDLHPLLPSDRQRVDAGVWVDLETETLTGAMIRRRALRRSRKIGLAIVSAPSRMFSATVNTGTSMKCW